MKSMSCSCDPSMFRYVWFWFIFGAKCNFTTVNFVKESTLAERYDDFVFLLNNLLNREWSLKYIKFLCVVVWSVLSLVYVYLNKTVEDDCKLARDMWRMNVLPNLLRRVVFRLTEALCGGIPFTDVLISKKHFEDTLSSLTPVDIGVWRTPCVH